MNSPVPASFPKYPQCCRSTASTSLPGLRHSEATPVGQLANSFHSTKVLFWCEPIGCRLLYRSRALSHRMHRRSDSPCTSSDVLFQPRAPRASDRSLQMFAARSAPVLSYSTFCRLRTKHCFACFSDFVLALYRRIDLNNGEA